MHNCVAGDLRVTMMTRMKTLWRRAFVLLPVCVGCVVGILGVWSIVRPLYWVQSLSESSFAYVGVEHGLWSIASVTMASTDNKSKQVLASFISEWTNGRLYEKITSSRPSVVYENATHWQVHSLVVCLGKSLPLGPAGSVNLIAFPTWLIACMFPGIPVGYRLFVAIRALRRARAGQCIRCAYDLRGAMSGYCPECGFGTPCFSGKDA